MRLRPSRCLVIFLFLGAVSGENIYAQDFFISVDTTITVASTFENLTITGTGTLTANAPITVNGDMEIQSGGIVTHSQGLLSGLQLYVGGNLEIQEDASIYASGKGLRGGRNSGNSSADGETYNDEGTVYPGVTGNALIGSSYYAGAGASYGGRAGYAGDVDRPVPSNEVYGNVEEAVLLGSGGGGIYADGVTRAGGNGGGLIRIEAGACSLEGSIKANGANSVGVAGGGSGGSIRLDLGILEGGGAIEAFGGVAGDLWGGGGGSGSGGRIAISFDSQNFPLENIKAYGGSSNNSGAPGTVYYRENGTGRDVLTIDNWSVRSDRYTPVRTELDGFGRVSFQNHSKVLIESSDAISVEEPVVLKNEAILQVGGTISVINDDGFDLDVQSSSILILDPLSVFNASAVRVHGGTLNSYVDLSIPSVGDLELSDRGRINMLDSTTLSLGEFTPTNIRNGTVSIPLGSRLDVSSLSVTVGDSVTLVKDGKFGASDSLELLRVLSGGVVTHSVYTGISDQGLLINVAGEVDIQSGGAIDVSGKGLRGGRSSGNTSVHGETYDANGDVSRSVTGNVNVDNAYYAGAAASYGGRGGFGGRASIPVPSSHAYGVFELPVQYGSGGGGVYAGGSPPNPGGNGGGLIHIVAETCIVDGRIRANGTTGGGGYGLPGGGSGGCIFLDVENLLSAGEGTIEALGGAGKNAWSEGSGSGGGGRIAIYCGTMNLPIERVVARGGSSNYSGAAGTVYLKNNAHSSGDLIIDNEDVVSSQRTPNMTELTAVRDLIVTDRGALGLIQEIAIENVLKVTDGGLVENEPE